MIYFAQAEADSPIKVGCTTAPELRMRQLQIDTRSPMRLILAVPGGKPEEAYVNARLADHVVSPEWFHCCGDVLIFIAECRAAQAIVGFVPDKGGRPRKKEVAMVADWNAIHEMRARRAQGWTFSQIARERGVSRQAVQQTLAHHFRPAPNAAAEPDAAA